MPAVNFETIASKPKQQTLINKRLIKFYTETNSHLKTGNDYNVQVDIIDYKQKSNGEISVTTSGGYIECNNNLDQKDILRVANKLKEDGKLGKGQSVSEYNSIFKQVHFPPNAQIIQKLTIPKISEGMDENSYTTKNKADIASYSLFDVEDMGGRGADNIFITNKDETRSFHSLFDNQITPENVLINTDIIYGSQYVLNSVGIGQNNPITSYNYFKQFLLEMKLHIHNIGLQNIGLVIIKENGKVTLDAQEILSKNKTLDSYHSLTSFNFNNKLLYNIEKIMLVHALDACSKRLNFQDFDNYEYLLFIHPNGINVRITNLKTKQKVSFLMRNHQIFDEL